MNPARRSRNPNGARPVPGRSGHFGTRTLEVFRIVAGARPLRARTARAPEESQRTTIPRH